MNAESDTEQHEGETAAARTAAAEGAEPSGTAEQPVGGPDGAGAAPGAAPADAQGDAAAPGVAPADAEGDAAAAPAPAEPDLAAAPTGEEAFTDADAPPATAEPDRYLALAQRTQADFDNFRKRAAREAAGAAERGVGRLARELLPALDHLELALQAVEQDPAHAEIAKGFRLVQDELAKALGRAGVEAFSPQGEPFDPTQHEAMTQQPVEGAESGTVAQVYQRGYRLGQSVLRPARVIVAA